jgi:hypothetical protein
LGHAPDHWKISKAIMIYKDNHECSRTCQLDLQNLCLYDPATPLTLLTNISIHTNMVFARIDLSPLLYFSSAISPNVLKGTPPLYTSFFLDRPQASDPIGHPHSAAALQRYVVPPVLVQAIMALYHNGQFFVSDLSFHSPQYTFRRGIWQGCPLSP